MPDTELDVEVVRGSRKVDEFALRADPGNSQVLADALRGWLAGHGWHKDLWPQFHAVVRLRGKNRVVVPSVRP